MHPNDLRQIEDNISPLINRGEISLLLGAGFSLGNITAVTTKIPSGDGLRDMLLDKCGKKAGNRTTLKDAYLYASRELPDFNKFLEDCFTIKAATSWQEKVFSYVWNGIFSTNIDNVLEVAHMQAKAKGVVSAEFGFFNFTEPHLVSNAIGTVPVVSIHGSIKKQSDGFIFANMEYGNAASRTLDWHNELAARIMVGGLVVIGNQLDEADIDAHLAARKRIYGETLGGKNWIVMPSPDEIKRENYVSAGFDVIDATAEEFFKAVFSKLPPRTIDDIIQEVVPASKQARFNLKAMSWFKEAFNPVIREMDRANNTTGILRHFITGAEPSWFYIINSAHSTTSKISELIGMIGNAMKAKDNGVSIINVIGSSGSGKSTAIRAALSDLVKNYPYIYEYDSINGIDEGFLGQIISGFTAKSIFVFYSAAEFYYAINAISSRLKDKDVPHCLFILEDRMNDYKRNIRQLGDCKAISRIYEMGPLSLPDALSIAEKIEKHGLSFTNFSEYPINKRAQLIVDKERGFGGDLLSALFSLTTHENFEQKIYQDYSSVKNDRAKQILDAVAIMNSLGFQTPIKYVAGFLRAHVAQIEDCLSEDLSGIVLCPVGSMRLSCRHRVIANYYFENCIAGQGKVQLIVDMLGYLSTQFSIDDIKHHPLAYQMYKNIISFDFLFEKYYPINTKRSDTEQTYHEAQKHYGKDGVFWLHFGRFYRKIGELDEAIDCFRTGLTHYDSFQTRHSLGTALLDRYIQSNCAEQSSYEEGVTILENERVLRGVSDAYPITTLIDLLIKVVKLKQSHADAKERLKNCINYGLKHFKDDEFFSRKAKEYFALPK